MAPPIQEEKSHCQENPEEHEAPERAPVGMLLPLCLVGWSGKTLFISAELHLIQLTCEISELRRILSNIKSHSVQFNL